MIFNDTSLRLSSQQALGLTKVCLENSRQTTDFEISLVLCDDAVAALSQVKRTTKQASKGSVQDQTTQKEIATAYIELGTLQVSLSQSEKAKVSYKKAEKWG